MADKAYLESTDSVAAQAHVSLLLDTPVSWFPYGFSLLVGTQSPEDKRGGFSWPSSAVSCRGERAARSAVWGPGTRKEEWHLKCEVLGGIGQSRILLIHFPSVLLHCPLHASDSRGAVVSLCWSVLGSETFPCHSIMARQLWC
ncbi:hypothetical protein Y1Q_0020395 [Alligator mississippiensis]|uniref:Uncharacterized protein n=1 Tax=Alligator mississippiensis TaxID=8496 RepID=A0A151N6S6_ALLMI|nr:hypothetical protein Y1Q_0020395 [Alligator mississippiensis]